VAGGIHSVISQKMILFNTTAVKTSNPTVLGTFMPSVVPENLDWFIYFYAIRLLNYGMQ
jgi:hypothetical protein